MVFVWSRIHICLETGPGGDIIHTYQNHHSSDTLELLIVQTTSQANNNQGYNYNSSHFPSIGSDDPPPGVENVKIRENS